MWKQYLIFDYPLHIKQLYMFLYICMKKTCIEYEQVNVNCMHDNKQVLKYLQYIHLKDFEDTNEVTRICKSKDN